MLGLTAWWRWKRPFRVAVEGRSMVPSLEPGDFLIAIANSRPKRGSLVVVEHPGLPGYEVVKRLAGVPGDESNGRVLGPDEHWVAGDNPAMSTDSRHFGPVPRRAIKGVVRVRYWPPARTLML